MTGMEKSDNVDKKNLLRLIKISYKKLKAHVYYDKTMTVLRDKIVQFEREPISKDENPNDVVENKLNMIADNLIDDGKWIKFKSEILSTISVLAYPKKIKKIENNILFNNDDKSKISIDEYQYFINLSVEGHILGVLWILLVGRYLDNERNMYKHSYGNRLRKTLVDKNGEVTYFPNLFQPYFSQYENWRDKGLTVARECMKDGNDVVIVTIDFKRYFYSINFEQNDFNDFLDKLDKKDDVSAKVNELVYDVIYNYSRKFMENIYDIDKKGFEDIFNQNKDANVLPIGFLPSNILGNVGLNNFDTALVTRWNPVYYGRYVDDIILVDKVDNLSNLYKDNLSNEITKEHIIDYYFGLCNADKTLCCRAGKELLKKDLCNDKVYYINKNYLSDNQKSKVLVQNDKVKVFYFSAKSTDALITCFQNEIAKNASGFRYMPEINSSGMLGEYSNILDLDRKDTINKFSAIKDVKINKYEVSKLLGKWSTVSYLLGGKINNTSTKEFLKVFDKKNLILNYNIWERIFELLVIEKDYESYKNLYVNILEGIKCLCTSNEDLCSKSLLLYLHSTVIRSIALSWNENIDDLTNELIRLSKKYFEDIIGEYTKVGNYAIELKDIKRFKRYYCETRMINKYIIPVLVDALLINGKWNRKFRGDLFDFSDTLQYFKIDDVTMHNEWNKDVLEYVSDYCYYPYVVTPQDIAFSQHCLVLKTNSDILDFNEYLKVIKEKYYRCNYFSRNDFSSGKKGKDIFVESYNMPNMNFMDVGLRGTCIKIDSEKKDKLRVAVGNAVVRDDYVYDVLKRKNRVSIDRYIQLEKILREAVREKVDLLVLPECYLPIAWISKISRFSAQNQIAIVTGIEHIVVGSDYDSIRPHNEKCCVHNLTATILPYKLDEYKYSHVDLREKVFYSPEEKRIIKGYGYSFKEGKTFNIFCWHNIWFPTFCCFELASIYYRALFRNIADLFIAVEWNKDTKYYSNIVESLCRDLHCYCIQVNSADFGDSRVVQPTNSDNMDIVRSKGGINNTILVGEININRLRNHQIKNYELQKDSKEFKPTPPGFDKNIVFKKIKGTLWSDLQTEGLL